MKAASAMVILGGLLFSMIGVAWSQNSNTSGDANAASNALPRNRATGGRGRDVGPANKNPFNSAAYANSGNSLSNVGDPRLGTAAVNANTWATNAAANTAPPARRTKPKRPAKKPRKIAGTPTIGKLLAGALTAGLTR